MPRIVIGRPADVPSEFAELSIVRLSRAIDSAEGRLPKGSAGTIVGRYDGGHGYEVEFNTPFHTVATIAAHDLEQ